MKTNKRTSSTTAPRPKRITNPNLNIIQEMFGDPNVEEQLGKKHLELGELIRSIAKNYSKDSPDRKTKQYFLERQRRLNEQWKLFQEVDAAMQDMAGDSSSQPYFGNNYLNTTKNIYNKLSADFTAQIETFELPDDIEGADHARSTIGAKAKLAATLSAPEDDHTSTQFTVGLMLLRKGSDQQKCYLLKYLKKNIDFARENINEKCSKEEIISKWHQLTERLNQMEGAEKNAQAWRKYWKDLVSRAKQKFRDHTDGSNMLHANSFLSSDDQTILKIIGHGNFCNSMVSTANHNTPEFLDTQRDYTIWEEDCINLDESDDETQVPNLKSEHESIPKQQDMMNDCCVILNNLPDDPISNHENIAQDSGGINVEAATQTESKKRKHKKFQDFVEEKFDQMFEIENKKLRAQEDQNDLLRQIACNLFDIKLALKTPQRNNK